MIDSSKILEFIKLSGKQAFILFVITSILLFSSEELLNSLGLIEIKKSINTWIGIFWLLSVSLLAAEILHPIYKWCADKIKYLLNLKKHQERLRSLTNDEKLFLSVYIKTNTRTQDAEFSDGTVSGLTIDNIVYRASGMSQYHKVFAYNISTWAFDYLKKNQDCLEMNT
jgi:hypothetical protein